MATQIKIIYDNDAEKGYISGWGFAAIIQHNGKTILFDTGWSGAALMHNLETASIDPKSIDYIIISHKHWDHIGGLDTILKATNHPIVYLPITISSKLKIEILNDSELREVTKNNFEKVSPGVFTTPLLKTKLKELDEIALIIETKKGLVVICGCSHPGLDKIIAKARKKGKVHSVLGGFHGFKKLKKFEKINVIIPCHCTKKKQKILDSYPEKSKKCFAGAKYYFE